jgi:hypothetical protein
MTRSIQSIFEIRRNAYLCAEQGAPASTADDLELDVREILLAAFHKWHAKQPKEKQA